MLIGISGLIPLSSTIRDIENIMKKIILALLVLLFTGSALAAHDSGLYVEGNLGLNYDNVNFLGEQISSFREIGVNGNLGYQFTTHFAGEVGYTDYISGSNNRGWDMAGKFILPVGRSLYVFAKAGLTGIKNNDHSNTLPYTGLGAGYALTPALDINVQTQGDVFMNSGNAIGLLSGGLTYHF